MRNFYENKTILRILGRLHKYKIVRVPPDLIIWKPWWIVKKQIWILPIYLKISVHNTLEEAKASLAAQISNK